MKEGTSVIMKNLTNIPFMAMAKQLHSVHFVILRIDKQATNYAYSIFSDSFSHALNTICVKYSMFSR